MNNIFIFLKDMLKRLLQINTGSATLIIVFLALLGFFGVTLTASDIIHNNLVMSKNQFNSTKAYFAAEVGLEQALWEVMKGDYELPPTNEEDVFNSVNDSVIRNFLNTSSYQVNYDRENSVRTFVSRGINTGEHRTAEVRFCIPDCEGKSCGEDDGCGILCPSTCITNPGCSTIPLASAPSYDMVEVVGSEGACCDSGGTPQFCYECADGFAWDGDSCEYVCEQDCTGLGCGDLDFNCFLPCPSTCSTYPGCAGSQPSGTREVADSSGDCCGGETCYECDEGYQWNGSSCEACAANYGEPYDQGPLCSTANDCYNCGFYDCDGVSQVPAASQPAAGTPCVGGNPPVLNLKLDENSGIMAYDASPEENDAIFNGGYWQYRKRIVIDHNQIDYTLNNFPLLLEFSDSDLADYAQDDGDDIYFRDSNGVKMDHEIEYYDPSFSSGHLIVWLRIPTLSSTADTIVYMYYGNASVPSQENPDGVWDSGYKGVWHLKEDIETEAEDSSGFANNGAFVGDLPNSSLSPVYMGQTFDGGDYINVGSGDSLNLTSDLTISAWIRTDPWQMTSQASNRAIFGASGFWFLSYPGYEFRFTNATSSHVSFYSSNYGVWVHSNTDVQLNDGNWHQVVVSLENNAATFYIDGEVDNITTSRPPGTNTGARSIGLSNQAAVFLGGMDEVRVSGNTRNLDWIKTAYNNQMNPGVFASLGSQESLTPSAPWNQGKYGQAIEFDGLDDYLTVADDTSLDLVDGITVSAWVKVPLGYSEDANQVLVQKRNGSGYSLYHNTGGLGPSFRIHTTESGAATNLTLNKTATQSSNYSSVFYLADNTVDGNLSTFNATTNYSAHEWLMVDLGAEYWIGKVEVVKRADCCYSWPDTYEIQFSSTGSFSGEETVVVNQNTSSCNTSNCVMTHNVAPTFTRYIRLYNNSADRYISIAELRVFEYVPTCTNEKTLYTGQSITDNDWHHIAGTYDGSSIKIYMDGVLRNSDSYVGTLCINDTDLRVGASTDTSDQEFSGLIDEVKVYDYARTQSEIQSDMEQKVCDGAGSCINLASALVNSSSYQSCDDVCWGLGQQCDSVGTDTNASNGLMRVYNSGVCDYTNADCSTVMVRNPDTAMPFICGGYQTNWTNCNCTLCASNFGEACGGNSCIVAGTGSVNCEGECVNPTYEPAGTSCGYYMECDGIGNCRSLCHPLFEHECGGNLCATPGTVACDGTCEGAVTWSDGTNCEAVAGETESGECWDCDNVYDLVAQTACYGLGIGTQCYPCEVNYGDICNDDQECIVRSNIDCFGNCPTGPTDYMSYGSLCNANGNPGTGYCDGASTVCTLCHSDYLADYDPAEGENQQCNDEECHIPGTIDCVSGGPCSSSAIEADGTICDSGVGGDSGYCLSGSCLTCHPTYMAAYDPIEGTAPACNDQKCHVPGTIDCETGICSTGSAAVTDGTSCDYDDDGNTDDGFCFSGSCQACVAYAGDDCNTEPCILTGTYNCAGSCSTSVLDYLQPGVWCDAGYPSSPNDPNTGKCDSVGNCDACAVGYINNDTCVPTGDAGCYNVLGVYNCEGDCGGYGYEPVGTWCDAGYGANTGTCDGSGNCDACVIGYINGDPCNTDECHVAGDYNCDGTCTTGPSDHLAEGTACDAGSGPNTGECDANGNCVPCGALAGTVCVPSGDNTCWSPLGIYECDGVTCAGAVQIAPGTPCDGDGNECDYDGFCTTPLTNIIVLNSRTNKNCTTICNESPYDNRACISIGTDGTGGADNGKRLYDTGYWCQTVNASCSTGMGAGNGCYASGSIWIDIDNYTYCNCLKCEANYGEECQWREPETIVGFIDYSCNTAHTYSCDGTCPYSYRTGTCDYDGDGAVYDGYCDSTITAGQRPCLACVPESQPYPQACNTDDCLTDGIVRCEDGHCFVGSYTVYDCTNPANNTACYRPLGTSCNDGAGECAGPDGATIGSTTFAPGECMVCDSKYNDPCPLEAPYDDECFNPGVYDCDGETCVGTQYLNDYQLNQYMPDYRTGYACTEDITGQNLEGRCIYGECVPCDQPYLDGDDCPVVSPYDETCYYGGYYECYGEPGTNDFLETWNTHDSLYCLGAYNMNQGGYCPTQSWICVDGICEYYPDQFKVLNQGDDGLNRSCDQICQGDYDGYLCNDVGTNRDLVSNNQAQTEEDLKGNPTCDTTSAYCSTVLPDGSITCSAYNTTETAAWTWCLCGKCTSNVGVDCPDDPAYDSECYYSGRYDCDGNCMWTEVINEDGVCYDDNTGDEGRCSAGICNPCAADFLNEVPCPTCNCCTVEQRQCDGTCPAYSQAGIGSTCAGCGTGDCVCDASGSCVSSASLPDIVVPNFYTNRNCYDICDDYLGRYCESVGTDYTDQITGGTNGNGMFYGIVDDQPSCVEAAAGCSSFMQQSPSDVADPDYGWDCPDGSGDLTDWTYCRCSNE